MITIRPATVAVMLCAISAVACSGRPANTSPPGSAGTPASAPAPAAAHGTTAQPAQGGTQSVTGTVVETMNASNYTYVRVKTESGEVWAATSQFPVAVGDRVTVPLESPMEHFHSQSLKRDFPLIYFASYIARDGAPGAGAAGGTAHGGQATGAATQTIAVTEPIAPPPGGMTIAKIWADRQSLAGKKVTVRGKVVKYNGGIMDRNWLHVQDGSGNAADGTNDLTLTTSDEAKLGDVITVVGTVTLDKDFGAGYRYTVMLENATLAAK